jgi:hypothetical protein
MNFEELMDILPHLSSEEIKNFWHPAMALELLRTKQKHGEAVRPRDKSSDDAFGEHQVSLIHSISSPRGLSC